MNQADLVNIRKIATNARRWAVRANERLRNQGPTTNGFPRDLCGMCAIASAYLLTQLQRAGYPAVAYEGEDHFFVMCDNYVIDITATQFGGDPVVVRSRNSIRNQSEYQRIRGSQCTTAEEIRERQLRTDWPRSQTVWAELAAGDGRIHKHVIAYC